MSAPVPWDHDAAIVFVRKALERIGGKDRLTFDVRMEYALADAAVSCPSMQWWIYMKASYGSMRQYETIKCREAMIIIESRNALNNSIVEAQRRIYETFGDNPKGRQGRNEYEKMLRNQFIYDCLDILQDAGYMKRNDAIAVVAEVLSLTRRAIREAFKAYSNRDPDLWPIICWAVNRDLWSLGNWTKYEYMYERLSLPEPD